MPATRHLFTKCGHKGFGAPCHRCQEADRLEAIAEGKVKPAQPGKGRPKDAKPAFEGWKKDAFLAEAKRLRAPAQRKSGGGPAFKALDLSAVEG